MRIRLQFVVPISIPLSPAILKEMDVFGAMLELLIAAAELYIEATNLTIVLQFMKQVGMGMDGLV